MAALKSVFKGKDTKKEELREAKAVRAGKVSPKQYVKGEKMEGEKASIGTGKKLKSGALSPATYAKGKK